LEYVAVRERGEGPRERRGTEGEERDRGRGEGRRKRKGTEGRMVRKCRVR
jgi:hypothetical protein